MSLIDLRNHLRHVKVATLGSLCGLFNADPETVRCLLRHWVNKGCVRQCTKQPACGTQCVKCPASVTEIYEWIDLPATI